ncbi:MAG: ATP-binding cassette domain-containing protein [Planctomycetes bacterium]|nr:ATP-binding cassette domain-containing protein [Planctomycetota bacterium]
MPPVAVELLDVHKTLGGREVLSGLSLQVYRGETFAIIGGSGQGKSVTLKHIVGLLAPDRGVARVNGLAVNGRSDHLSEIRRQIGYLFQEGALLRSITVFENVALPLREHEKLAQKQIEERVMNKLALVRLADAAAKYPSELSGGMRKRASLARAIVRDPSIILYDEPTSGLDPVTSSTINDLILDLQRKLGVTSILVTHDMASAFRVAHRMGMLLGGKLIKIGTPEEFKTSEDPVIRQFIHGESEGPLTREAP